MKVLVTGTSQGIGLGVAKMFLEKGHTVFGFDMNEAAIVSPNYNHYIVDIRDVENYPEIPNVDILVNNAGVQSAPGNIDIDVNLKGTISITEHYGIHP